MKVVITALTAAKRGEPITCGRHYVLLPICNEPLIQRQMEMLGVNEVTLLVRDHAKEFGELASAGLIRFCNADDADATASLMDNADVVIPGDLLPMEKVEHGLIVHPNGSEELDAVRSLTGLQEATTRTVRINYAWELLTANQAFATTMEATVDETTEIEEGVTINGTVVAGKNTRILAGTYIEGPVIIGNNCVIGPQAHLRADTFIGNNCIIGKTEVVDAIIMDESVSKHHGYIGHSVIGKDVNFGALSVTSDYRHDGNNHTTLLHNKKIDTGRRKLGAFIGDKCRIAVSTSFYPGRKLWPGKTTLPGEIVKEDK